MFVFLASLNTFADASPGAFDKLRTMFDKASAPASIDAVYAEISKIKGCAASYEQFPNEIHTSEMPIKVTHATTDFGPDFPSEVLVGIAFNSRDKIDAKVSTNFFESYSESLQSDGLKLNTREFYRGRECDDDSDGNRVCGFIDKTRDITPKIRLTSKYLVYENGTEYAYCWK